MIRPKTVSHYQIDLALKAAAAFAVVADAMDESDKKLSFSLSRVSDFVKTFAHIFTKRLEFGLEDCLKEEIFLLCEGN